MIRRRISQWLPTGRDFRLVGWKAGRRVLDIGCCTGTLAVLIMRQHPGAVMVGLGPAID